MSEAEQRRSKILVAIGPDDDGRALAASLRDVGMEVVYMPRLRTLSLVKLALEEDVDVVATASAADLLPELTAALRRTGLGHVRVVSCGILPSETETALLQAGVARILHPRTCREDIVAEIARLAREARGACTAGAAASA